MRVPDGGKEGEGSWNLSSAHPVFEAVRQGDVDGVRAFLKAGVDVNLSSRKTGRTLLHFACHQGCVEMVSLLLFKGANPRAKTLRYLSPLHLACNQGHFKVSRLLLEAWASVDDRDQAGTTPLHLSSRKGDPDIVRILLQCSADRNGLDQSGWTPLHYAAWRGHAEVARMLIQAGANSRAVDLRDKITPLHLACASGYPVVAKVLLEFGADSNAIDCHGVHPDDVIGKAGLGDVDPSQKRELNEILVGHRTKIKGYNESPSSLECVVDSLRAKVSELEDQLRKSTRDDLEALAYSADEDYHSFAAALKPECAICLFGVKEAVLDPCRHLATCSNCAVSLPSCPFCGCPVVGYEYLESRQMLWRIAVLERECMERETEMERFSNIVCNLASENGQLKLEIRRAEADAALLRTKQMALDTFIAETSHISPLSSRSPSCQPRLSPRDDKTDGSSFDGHEAILSSPCLVENDSLRLNDGSDVHFQKRSGGGRGANNSIPKTIVTFTRVTDAERGEIALANAMPDAVHVPDAGKGGGLFHTEGVDLHPMGMRSVGGDEHHPSLAAVTTYSTQSNMLPMKVSVRHRSLKNDCATNVMPHVARDGGSPYVCDPRRISISGSTSIGDDEDQKSNERSIATSERVHELKGGHHEEISRMESDSCLRMGKLDSSAERDICSGEAFVADDVGAVGASLDHKVQHQHVRRIHLQVGNSVPNTESSPSELTSVHSEGELFTFGRADQSSIDVGKTAHEVITIDATNAVDGNETTGEGPVNPRAVLFREALNDVKEDRLETKGSLGISSKGIVSEGIGNTADVEIVSSGFSAPTDNDCAAEGCKSDGILSGSSFSSLSSLFVCHIEYNSVASTSTSSSDDGVSGPRDKGKLGSCESASRAGESRLPSGQWKSSRSKNTAPSPKPSYSSGHGAGLTGVCGSRHQSISSRSPSPVVLERVSSGKGSMARRVE